MKCLKNILQFIAIFNLQQYSRLRISSGTFTDGTVGHARDRLADILLGSYENGANEQQKNGDARMQPEDHIVDADRLFLQKAFNRCEKVQHGYRVFLLSLDVSRTETKHNRENSDAHCEKRMFAQRRRIYRKNIFQQTLVQLT